MSDKCMCEDCLNALKHPYKKQLETLYTIYDLYSLKRRSKKDILLGSALIDDIMNHISFKMGTKKCPRVIYDDLSIMKKCFEKKRRDINERKIFINYYFEVKEFFRIDYLDYQKAVNNECVEFINYYDCIEKE